MSDEVGSYYTSVPFKFVVDGNPYYIHKDLVSLHSKPLNCMMNGSMEEAQKGYAILKEVDGGTFERFIEWAYKGFYTAATFGLHSSSSSPASPNKDDCGTDEIPEVFEISRSDEESREVDLDTGDLPSPEGRKITKKRAAYKLNNGIKTERDLREVFLQREYTFRKEKIDIPSPRANRGADENYTEVFLSHARLYVFAETYDIQDLKILALENLHNTLAVYTLYRQRTGDIVTLLRYAYANTAGYKRDRNDLRTLLRHYVGYEMGLLMGDEEFKELMIEDGGALLSDFFRMVKKLIN
ncbi:hypothetical protein MMC13_002333 [Lambiella insularis]|nr:hypothetical protein [Lambiella insularis]